MPSNPREPWLDGALYPDTRPPDGLHTLSERIDFMARLCTAWDFGLLPDPQVIAEVRRAKWREAVDECRQLTSPSYHLLRSWHGLARLPYLGQRLAYIAQDPNLEYV